MATKKIGRPPNPTPHWDPDRKAWWVRVTMPKPPGRARQGLPGERYRVPRRRPGRAAVTLLLLGGGEGHARGVGGALPVEGDARASG